VYDALTYQENIFISTKGFSSFF